MYNYSSQLHRSLSCTQVEANNGRRMDRVETNNGLDRVKQLGACGMMERAKKKRKLPFSCPSCHAHATFSPLPFFFPSPTFRSFFMKEKRTFILLSSTSTLFLDLNCPHLQQSNERPLSISCVNLFLRLWVVCRK